jgi:hypothetical protein
VSVAVSLEELGSALERFTWCYVITIGERGSHLVAVTPRLTDGVLVADVGKSSVANASARGDVVLVFPPPDHTGMSLIVDATFESADPFTVRPTKATLHRPAPG